MRTSSTALWLLALLASFPVTVSCSEKAMHDTGLPGWGTEVEVVKVTPRGDYLEVRMQGDGFELHNFFANSEICNQVFQAGEPVSYNAIGPLGEFRRFDQQCNAIGVWDLVRHRNRYPSTGSLRGSPVPRAQANYRVILSEPDLILLRGSFPLASHLKFAGSDDLIAAITPGDQCDPVSERPTSSVEFRPSGKRALSLVGPSGLCEIQGLITPVGRQ